IARSTFERVSFDLIYARMGQTPEAWTAELDRALALGPDHLSLYQLTIEPETAFWALHQAGKLSVPRDEPAAEMYEITQERTEAAGLPSYEVSNHARPGAECRHNLIYWRGGLWAGIGPGAHGRIEIDGICHETETLRDPAGWLDSVAREGHGLARSEPSDGTARAEEYLMMAMRLSEGADLARFHALGGRLAPERLSWLAAEGFVETGADRLTASPRGRLVLNTVLSELLA
ncbi:MAG: coproporphyrinogen III oxidase, partial [Pseudomonadota bacterium]